MMVTIFIILIVVFAGIMLYDKMWNKKNDSITNNNENISVSKEKTTIEITEDKTNTNKSNNDNNDLSSLLVQQKSIDDKKNKINQAWNNSINRFQFSDGINITENEFVYAFLLSVFPLWHLSGSFSDSLYIRIGSIITLFSLVFINIAYHAWFKLQFYIFPLIAYALLIYNYFSNKGGRADDISFYIEVGLLLFLIYSIYQHFKNLSFQNEYKKLENKENEIKSKIDTIKNEIKNEETRKEKAHQKAIWDSKTPKQKTETIIDKIYSHLWNGAPQSAENLLAEWESEIKKHYKQSKINELYNSINAEWNRIREQNEQREREKAEIRSRGPDWQCSICGEHVHTSYGNKPLKSKCRMNSGTTSGGRFWQGEHSWNKM